MDAMDELHARGIKLAICTNKYVRFATALIDQMGLTQRFDAIIGGDTMGPGKSKPHAAPIAEMIQRCGGGRAVFLGDSINDTMAAKNAGIPSIAVSIGFLMQTIEDLMAGLVIYNYNELIPAVENWTVR